MTPTTKINNFRYSPERIKEALNGSYSVYKTDLDEIDSYIAHACISNEKALKAKIKLEKKLSTVSCIHEQQRMISKIREYDQNIDQFRSIARSNESLKDAAGARHQKRKNLINRELINKEWDSSSSFKLHDPMEMVSRAQYPSIADIESFNLDVDFSERMHSGAKKNQPGIVVFYSVHGVIDAVIATDCMVTKGLDRAYHLKNNLSIPLPEKIQVAVIAFDGEKIKNKDIFYHTMERVIVEYKYTLGVYSHNGEILFELNNFNSEEKVLINTEKRGINIEGVGCYIACTREGSVLYVGMSTELKLRISNPWNHHAIGPILREREEIFLIIIKTDEKSVRGLEGTLIEMLTPPKNIAEVGAKLSTGIGFKVCSSWKRNRIVKTSVTNGKAIKGANLEYEDNAPAR